MSTEGGGSARRKAEQLAAELMLDELSGSANA
jgi:dsRNA-specific ribonuclease